VIFKVIQRWLKPNDMKLRMGARVACPVPEVLCLPELSCCCCARVCACCYFSAVLKAQQQRMKLTSSTNERIIGIVNDRFDSEKIIQH
jgi:hypothetical protein